MATIFSLIKDQVYGGALRSFGRAGALNRHIRLHVSMSRRLHKTSMRRGNNYVIDSLST